MASLSEMIEYARAKQPKSPLAELAKNFVAGASSGYDEGKKSKQAEAEKILKAYQAIEAQEKARSLKMQNDLWDGFINEAKAQGQIPPTAGEVMTGRKVALDNLDSDKPKGAFSMSKIAQLFAGPDGDTDSVNVELNLPGNMGKVRVGKPKTGNPLPAIEEDRIVREKAFKMGLAMTQAQDPLAQEPSGAHLRLAFEYLGKDPDKYIKKKKVSPPSDPWGLLGGGAPPKLPNVADDEDE